MDQENAREEFDFEISRLGDIEAEMEVYKSEKKQMKTILRTVFCITTAAAFISLRALKRARSE